MRQILLILQIIISCLLIVFILLQQRGTALGAVFGQGESFYFKKRGIEKIVFVITIILSILFIGVSLLNLLIK
ncbi:preprotein translocase subunit SecG [bacterium (Candidatus Gribaldobacteria) CG_4_10_14_0_8_um_filter_33_9]|uniref:Protein-export membrane protein SecG n=1 Tax=bacterium (Candidatus Gribaldobacteria) CG_4_10_14_0_8_um_filter_33_9 TaxID=2014266 RepID=A0A2M7RMQ2_9BACT|nr:MAG: preprotein translocase subunit SecG [bacterium (Candidatus Gribaldobacteria) CG_4_10_14_0_8_um_filter_33_9]